MRKGLLLVLAVCTFSMPLKAQKIKTAVLVIGNGNSAWAAGLQAAVSNVETVILTQQDSFEIRDPELNLHSGIEQEFLRRMRKAQKITDSTTAVVVDQKTANVVIKNWGDSIRKLTVIRSVNYTKLSRSGNGWTVKLSNGKVIKAAVLIDAGNEDPDAANNLAKHTPATAEPLDYSNSRYRTSIASGDYLPDRLTTASFVALASILPEGEGNLVLANAMKYSMFAGQAAGAVAAYAAFYDTETSLVKLKEVQSELLRYKLALIPFADVSSVNTDWKAIQTIAIMGVLRADIKAGKAFFLPDQPVSPLEIKQPLKDLYYKAQIWFDDHVNTPVNLENTISLICYVGNKSLSELSAGIKKKWKTAYHFPGEFDLKHVLSRREFSVLVYDYLQPLTVNVDKSGKIAR